MASGESMTVKIVSTGLGDLSNFFESLPDVAETAMQIAINQVAERDGMNLIKRDMREQVDFPSGYLESRIKVTRKAQRGLLEAVIRGRDRATSLARFARGQNPGNTRGRPVFINVRKGQTRKLSNAFMVNLRNGNTGLAVRLKKGESLRNSQAAVRLADNVYLLYGPSVDQVMKGVADDRAGDISNMVSKQFLRQFDRLLK